MQNPFKKETDKKPFYKKTSHKTSSYKTSYIVMEITGGLGNQLFQYALGRRLAIEQNALLILDTSHYDTKYNSAGRTFKLNSFNIRAACTRRLSFLAPHSRLARIFDSTAAFIFGFNPLFPLFHREKNFQFNPEIHNLSALKGAYLRGWWQSEKYFSNIREFLLKEITLKNNDPLVNKPDPVNSKMLLNINSVCAVSVHVRRGDYVTSKSACRTHGTCAKDYYSRAFKYIEKKVKEPVFYIFSDDPDWAGQNINPPGKTIYVSHNKSKNDHLDLMLMKNCSHHIIANSTFSWWGAWLCTQPGKLVICPEKWFNISKKFTKKDLIPQEWTSL